MNHSLLRLTALVALLAAAAPASLLYVADPDSGSISTLTPGGVITPLITGLVYPRAIALQGGTLLVADNDQIRRYDASTGADLGLFASFTGVDAIIVDLLGNVFAASSTGGVVTRFDGAGTPTASISGLDSPGALALDDQGRLFVAHIDAVDGIQGYRYNAADLSALGVFITSNLNTPMAAAYRGNTLYLSNLFGGVDQVDTSGNVTTFASTGLSFPWGLVFDTNGDLYVASSSDGLVQRFNSAGTFQNTLASGFVTPAGMAFAPVPEPGSMALLGGALLAGGLIGRRRRSAC